VNNFVIIKSHINTIFKANSIEKVGAITCLNSINDIDKIIDEYEININDRIDILLSIFGLFQALYVGIDSMYDLVAILFSKRDIVNINRNPLLKKLRSIRNDCIGHPTNREYSYNSLGFCQIDKSKLNKTKFFYNTYLFNAGTYNTYSSEINILYLINEYKKEKNKLIKELNYIITNNESFYEIKLLIDKINQNLNINVITEITTQLLDNKLISNNSKILYRLNLIKDNLNSLKDDPYLIFKYALNYQIKELYLILNFNDYVVNLSEQIKNLKQYIKETKLVGNHLNDYSSYFFFLELDELITKCSDIKIKKVLEYVKNIIKEENHYIIYECIFK
jgi:hypothetical protein